MRAQKVLIDAEKEEQVDLLIQIVEIRFPKLRKKEVEMLLARSFEETQLYREVWDEGKIEGEIEGVIKGKIEGKIEGQIGTLQSLVEEGNLPLEIAAPKIEVLQKELDDLLLAKAKEKPN